MGKAKKRFEKKMEFWCHQKDGPVITKDLKTGTITKEFKERTLGAFQYQNEYLKSAHWKTIRWHALCDANFICQKCRLPKFPLNVHHKTYLRRGNENPDDLIVLCRECHEQEHLKH